LVPDGTAEALVGLGEIAEVLKERGFPLLLHSSEPVGHAYPGKSSFGPEACVAFATRYPGVKTVLAHMGGGAFVYESMPEVRAILADVYYDTSAVPYLYDPGVYRAAEATAGTRKILFGSDYPLLSPKRYEEALSVLSPSARAAVLGGNAQEVFRL
jgi:hypothetical protein